MTSIKEQIDEAKQRQLQMRISSTARDMYTACVLDAVVVWMVGEDVDSALSAMDSARAEYLSEFSKHDVEAKNAGVSPEMNEVLAEFNSLMDRQRELIIKVKEQKG